jgi:hypothetical protein
MKSEDIIELHSLITQWAIRKGYGTKHLLAFFSRTLTGTLALHEYSDEFACATFYKMKLEFRKTVKEMQHEKQSKMPTVQ